MDLKHVIICVFLVVPAAPDSFFGDLFDFDSSEGIDIDDFYPFIDDDYLPIKRYATGVCYFRLDKTYYPREFEATIQLDSMTLDMTAKNYQTFNQDGLGMEYKLTNLRTQYSGFRCLRFKISYFGWRVPNYWCYVSHGPTKLPSTTPSITPTSTSPPTTSTSAIPPETSTSTTPPISSTTTTPPITSTTTIPPTTSTSTTSHTTKTTTKTDKTTTKITLEPTTTTSTTTTINKTPSYSSPPATTVVTPTTPPTTLPTTTGTPIKTTSTKPTTTLFSTSTTQKTSPTTLRTSSTKVTLPTRLPPPEPA